MDRKIDTIANGGVEYLFAVGAGVYGKKTPLSQEQRTYIENINWGKNILNDIDSNYQLLEEPLFADLKEFCNQCVSEYYNGLLQIPAEIEIVLSWANRTLPGEAHHLHRHPNSVVSGVYYLDNTEDCPIEFHSPALPNNPYSHPPTEFTVLNSDSRSLAVQANTAVCFPSYLWHQVPKSRARTPRYSIAFNAFFKKGQEIGSYATSLQL